MRATNDSSSGDQEHAALTEYIQDTHPGIIYAMARETAARKAAFALKYEPVRTMEWDAGRSMLRFTIVGSRLRNTSIAMQHGALVTHCSCPSQCVCEHILIALLTLKKLVSPMSLPDLRFSTAYLSRLQLMLAKRQANPASQPALVIERNGLRLQARLDLGAGYRNESYGSDPEPAYRFLSAMQYGGQERIVESFLQAFGAGAPIVLMDGKTRVPLTFMPRNRPVPVTVLDLSRGMVTVQKGFDDGRLLTESSWLMPGYHIDTASAVIEPVAPGIGWNAWESISRNFYHQQSKDLAALKGADRRYLSDESAISQLLNQTRIPAGDFNRLCIDAPGTGDSMIMTEGGARVRPEDRPMPLEMHVDLDSDEERAFLNCVLIINGQKFPLPAMPYGMLTQQESWRFSAPLRAKKRMRVLIAAAFDLRSCTTAKEGNARLKEAFAGPDFKKRGVATEAKRFARRFASVSSGEFGVLQTDGAQWRRCARAFIDMSRLLEIPYRMFGPAVFDGSITPGETIVPQSVLLSRLFELKSRVEAAGFALFVNDQVVRQVTWEIAFDATSSTIDWFELRPEVRCDGAEIGDEEFAQAMEGEGVYLKNGEFLMLDGATRSVLSLLPGLKSPQSSRAEPVRIPRLQILDLLHLRSHGVRVKLSEDDERIFGSLQSFAGIPELHVPDRLMATLRPYQTEGYRWLAFLYEHRFGACLADDMGLGKTLQAISLLAGLREGRIRSRAPVQCPHLIVVPPTLLFNWEHELAHFYPALTVMTYRGTDRKAEFSGVDIVLTSYGVVQRDADILANEQFHVLVFDEAQSVKNIQTDTTAACRRLKAVFSLTLTGTPVENHLGEYYSIMDISVPGLLGEYAQFRRTMANVDDAQLKRLVQRTRPFILRRTKSLIASELPPKIESDIYLELTDEQKRLYTRTIEEVRSTVEEAYRWRTAGQARIIALTAILRLRQLCLSPELLQMRSKVEPPKLDFLIDQLGELFSEGHSVLVFSQFTSFLDIVERRLAREQLPFLRLDGSTSVGERKKLVTSFQRSEAPTAFLLSLKAGGRGLNLTRATYVFHLDPWWNPAVEDQASDRAHRIGQTSQVTITRLLMRHTIEEKMMELKTRKLALYKALLKDATTPGAAAIGREDIDYLLASS